MNDACFAAAALREGKLILILVTHAVSDTGTFRGACAIGVNGKIGGIDGACQCMNGFIYARPGISHGFLEYVISAEADSWHQRPGLHVVQTINVTSGSSATMVAYTVHGQKITQLSVDISRAECRVFTKIGAIDRTKVPLRFLINQNLSTGRELPAVEIAAVTATAVVIIFYTCVLQDLGNADVVPEGVRLKVKTQRTGGNIQQFCLS